MRIRKRIKNFFWETRKIRHKNENLILMISLYYCITVIFMVIFSLLKWNSEISNIGMDLLTVAILYVIYSKFVKNDLDLWFWDEDEEDTKHWEKSKMTLKVFLVLFILTATKGIISISFMDFIYTLKGIENPIIPGSVSDLGTSPSTLVRAIIIGPITEELIFREAGLSKFRRKDNKLEAIIFTAIVFGLMHGNLAQAINATIGGLIYGYVAIEYGIIYSIIFHIINNGMVYLEYFLNIENLFQYVSIVAVIILIITCTKQFIIGLVKYSRVNQKYSLKRQLLYFMNPALIIFLTLWIVGIILSV